MKKQAKLKARETAATNSDFYNLFRPIAPGIEMIGKIAQVISGLTEAVTIWFIMQSELSGANKTVSILVSIAAMLLVVALLELGGRKFLQVLTRAVVWKRLRSAWYIALFAIVSSITIGMGVLSFNLSTNGVQYAFTSGVNVHQNFDDSALKQEYHNELKRVNQEFDKELSLIRENQDKMVAVTTSKFETRIQAARIKANDYTRKYNEGQKWARSQADKYHKEAVSLTTRKSAVMADLTEQHSQQLDKWRLRKSKAQRSEKTNLQNAIAKGERNMKNQSRSRSDTAHFWGSLFSFFVGFSVILAFICIISTEVFRRGSGIQVEYHEEEQEVPVWKLFLQGFNSRFDGFFRSKAERFAQVPGRVPSAPTIGFSRHLPAMSHTDQHELPGMKAESKEVL